MLLSSRLVDGVNKEEAAGFYSDSFCTYYYFSVYYLFSCKSFPLIFGFTANGFFRFGSVSRLGGLSVNMGFISSIFFSLT